MQVRVCLERKVLPRFTSENRLDVFVTDLSTELLRQLSSVLERQMGNDEFRIAFASVSKQAGKQKQDFELLFLSLKPLFSPSNSMHLPSIIVLWTRHNENFYKLII